MRELIATIHLTAFSRFDADSHVERLTNELHAVRTGVMACMTLRREESPVTLRPAWLRGELLELPPHQIEMEHTVSERHGRFYCTTKLGIAGPPLRLSEDEEPMPETVRACPSSRRH